MCVCVQKCVCVCVCVKMCVRACVRACVFVARPIETKHTRLHVEDFLEALKSQLQVAVLEVSCPIVAQGLVNWVQGLGFRVI